MKPFELEITQYYIEDCLKRASVTSLIFYMWLEKFNMKYGLNTDFVTVYNGGCDQAVKKCIKGLDIAVQNNKSLSMKKSLTIIRKVQ